MYHPCTGLLAQPVVANPVGQSEKTTRSVSGRKEVIFQHGTHLAGVAPNPLLLRDLQSRTSPFSGRQDRRAPWRSRLPPGVLIIPLDPWNGRFLPSFPRLVGRFGPRVPLLSRNETRDTKNDESCRSSRPGHPQPSEASGPTKEHGDHAPNPSSSRPPRQRRFSTLPKWGREDLDAPAPPIRRATAPCRMGHSGRERRERREKTLSKSSRPLFKMGTIWFCSVQPLVKQWCFGMTQLVKQWCFHC